MFSFFPSVSLFFLMVVLSVLVTVSSSSWMMAWVGMELNMLSFLPLITMGDVGSYHQAEAAGKYFLAQAGGTALFLFSPVVWSMPYQVLSMVFIVSGLLLKMGAAPLHQWFPSVVGSLSWGINFVLMTWQKISPLMVLLAVVSPSVLEGFFFLGAVNLLFGAFGGLAQTQFRPLFAYSSISHMGWMISLVGLSMVGFLCYVGVYMMILAPVIYVMMKLKVSSVKVLSFLSVLKKSFLFFWGVMLLSLGGMPPFSGFFMKAFSVYILVSGGFVLLSVFFVICATLSLAYYINILFLGVLCGSSGWGGYIDVKVSLGLVMAWGFSVFGLPLLVSLMV